MKSFLPLILIWVFISALRTNAQQANLVPNHGFEEFSGVPLGWFYNGSQFTRLVKYWNSPTLASPDAFGPGIIVPSHWKKKGFGKMQAQEGKAMAGLTVYGCADGKPHCREYIQIQLNESLVKGQKYEVSYHLGHLDKSLLVDKIGVYFTIDPLKQDDDKVVEAVPQVYCNNVVKPESGKWRKINKEFTAEEEFNYLTMGNFFADDMNSVDREGAIYEFAYYYIDNIELRKVPPFLKQEVPEDDLTRQDLEVGKKIQLQNIYFDLDKSELLPRSFVELNKLKGILETNPQMTIEVHGHTDIQGESDYNLELSVQRSKAVTDYLANVGIATERIDFKGYGSNMPIANNADESGRQLNRRVEILITGL
jgi:outer membrane protein OmpA-like peptidoglycan-associated protein